MATKKTTKRSTSVLKEVKGIAAGIDFLMGIPEIAESFSRADIELALDDRGWERLGGAGLTTEVDIQSRNTTITKSRLYWLRDPLCKQAVRLWTDYSINTGMDYKAEDEGIQALLHKFCRSRKNRKLLSASGQKRSSRKLLIDGDVFFAIFGIGTADKTIRYLEPLQVTHFISDPNDEERVLAYRRVTKDKVLYYADWSCSEEELALVDTIKDPELPNKLVKLEQGVVVYHVPFDETGQRGNGLLSSGVDWSREHRRFMEARVAITQALSKFAWKLTAKGGQSVLNSLQQRLASTVQSTGTRNGGERNPPNAPASTWLQNNGLDMAQMPRATGAGDAKEDGNNLKLMMSAATNIMLHYFGDPSTGNLATATAMELPMLKAFQGYQQLWKDVYRDIFSIILDEELDDEGGEQELIDIDLPPILAEDLTKLGAFIGQLNTVFPEMAVPDILQMCLTAMGVDDIDEIMDKIAEHKVEVDKKKEQERQDQMALATSMPKTKQQQEAMVALAASLQEVASKL